MTREEFREQYPTPEYMRLAWDAMHEHFGAESMQTWEQACARARAEADAAYDAEYGAK